MSDIKYRSLKLIEKKRKKIYFKIWVISFLIGCLIGGIYYLSHHEFFKISEIKINELEFINKDDLTKIVDKELNKNLFFVLGKNNFVFLPKDEILNQIKTNFSEVKNINLKRIGFTSIEINIEEYKPVALWCQDKCFYLNENGFSFREAFDKKDLITFYRVDSDNFVGQNYLETESFKKILELVSLFNTLNIKINKIETKDNLSFYFYSDFNNYFLYEKDDDPKEIINNLNTLFEKEVINFVQLKNIEYIDLRFGNKIYYKIR